MYVEISLQLPPPPPLKQQKLGDKIFCETSVQVGMDLWKVHKQGRNENMQEDYTLLQNDGRKERQEDYRISVAYTANVG